MITTTPKTTSNVGLYRAGASNVETPAPSAPAPPLTTPRSGMAESAFVQVPTGAFSKSGSVNGGLTATGLAGVADTAALHYVAASRSVGGPSGLALGSSQLPGKLEALGRGVANGTSGIDASARARLSQQLTAVHDLQVTVSQAALQALRSPERQRADSLLESARQALAGPTPRSANLAFTSLAHAPLWPLLTPAEKGEVIDGLTRLETETRAIAAGADRRRWAPCMPQVMEAMRQMSGNPRELLEVFGPRETAILELLSPQQRYTFAATMAQARGSIQAL